MQLRIEFSGGLELLFDKKADVSIDLPDSAQITTVRQLLPWIRSNLLQERPELFLQGDSIRPGILVLINGVDWELEGELEYQLVDGDCITFISTLHGG